MKIDELLKKEFTEEAKAMVEHTFNEFGIKPKGVKMIGSIKHKPVEMMKDVDIQVELDSKDFDKLIGKKIIGQDVVALIEVDNKRYFDKKPLDIFIKDNKGRYGVCGQVSPIECEFREI